MAHAPLDGEHVRAAIGSGGEESELLMVPFCGTHCLREDWGFVRWPIARKTSTAAKAMELRESGRKLMNAVLIVAALIVATAIAMSAVS